ncbi:hypothetical protein [Histidinibacterium lentulum]|uniref:hypothetical protein n=1 Tax=Histidinibacterium lentulum TaxID=2480588 RepID=UPI0016079422|nr:hypothetical protein [Histidinibacterium lentulum]
MKALALAAAFAVMSTTQVAAQSILGPNKCAIIIGARQDLGAAQALVSAHGSLPFDGIYRTRNGWLAVVQDVVPASQGAARVGGRVSALRQAAPAPLRCRVRRNRPIEAACLIAGFRAKTRA